jgi:hypothetical protein
MQESVEFCNGFKRNQFLESPTSSTVTPFPPINISELHLAVEDYMANTRTQGWLQRLQTNFTLQYQSPHHWSHSSSAMQMKGDIEMKQLKETKQTNPFVDVGEVKDAKNQDESSGLPLVPSRFLRSLVLAGARLLLAFSMFSLAPVVEGRSTQSDVANGISGFYNSGAPLGSLFVGLVAILSMGKVYTTSINTALAMGKVQGRFVAMMLGSLITLGGLSLFTLADTEEGLP